MAARPLNRVLEHDVLIMITGNPWFGNTKLFDRHIHADSESVSCMYWIRGSLWKKPCHSVPIRVEGGRYADNCPLNENRTQVRSRSHHWKDIYIAQTEWFAAVSTVLYACPFIRNVILFESFVSCWHFFNYTNNNNISYSGDWRC